MWCSRICRWYVSLVATTRISSGTHPTTILNTAKFYCLCIGNETPKVNDQYEKTYRTWKMKRAEWSQQALHEEENGSGQLWSWRWFDCSELSRSDIVECRGVKDTNAFVTCDIESRFPFSSTISLSLSLSVCPKRFFTRRRCYTTKLSSINNNNKYPYRYKKSAYFVGLVYLQCYN